MNYQEFIKSKIAISGYFGFDIHQSEINQILKPHQKDIVQWAIKGGCRAIFASFGLGKSFMQLEILRIIGKHHGGRQLIIAPLGVRQEFKIDAGKLGIEIRFVRWSNEIEGEGLFITNYESVRDGRLDINLFNAVSLDEASCLRSYGSKTFQEFLSIFGSVRFKFVATATPSPNRFKELIHYAGFLGIMDTGQALTRFFKRDSTQANNLSLNPHMEKQFWLWVASWAIFLQKPSDLGYSDAGYVLPPLKIHYHEVQAADVERIDKRDGQRLMFGDASLSAIAAAHEKRSSIDSRIEKMMEIINALRRPRETEKLSEGILFCEKQGLDEFEQGKNVRITKTEQGKEQRKISAVQEGSLFEQQRSCGLPSPHTETKNVWINQGRLRKTDGSAKGCLCNLRAGKQSEEPILSSCGSLPQNREDSRPSLQQVQCRDRSFQGQSEIVTKSHSIPEQFIVWCDLDAEQKAIEKALRKLDITFVSLYGNTSVDERELLIMRWKNKEVSGFVSKPMMYGSGINMQQCCVEIFLGINFKANDFLQAIHRIWRFLQELTCEIHIIYASSEISVLETLKKKWRNHDIMVEKMTELIKKYGLSNAEMMKELQRTIGIERIEVKGENFTVANNDCVEESRLIEADSIGLIHTSIPFSNHYEYTPSYNDFGFTQDNDHFWKQMDYLTPELLRILKPGRIYACHVKDRILFGNVTGKGAPTVSPFHAECLFHSIKHGFDYMGMITVVTDVVRENNQTYRLGWTEQCKDGSKMGVGSPEYVLIFRKPQTDRTRGYADDPVEKTKEDYSRARWQVDAHAFWRSSGNRLLDSEYLESLPTKQFMELFKAHDLENIYDYESHVRIGEMMDLKGNLPSTFMSIAPNSQDYDVWTDINRMLTLNSRQTQRNVSNHICPLQTDLVQRIITRYSNSGDIVFDPFGGIMTVPLVAIKLGRKAMASELNHQYFLDGVKYLEAEERNKNVPTLFNHLEKEKLSA